MSASKLLQIIDDIISFVNISCDDSKQAETCSFNKELNSAKIQLNDGRSIGVVGLGTFSPHRENRFDKFDANKLTQQELKEHHIQNKVEMNEFKTAVMTAINYGYTHIDTAQRYRTEYIVGDAINLIVNDKNKNIQRGDLFITTKIARSVRDAESCRKCIDESLKHLQTNYIDLLLIHSPHSDKEKGERGRDVIELYKVMIAAQKNGKIKSIGVSNFGIKHLETLSRLKLRKPTVNQIEISPFLYETELIQYCKDNDIVLEGYCPLSQACDIAKDNELLASVGSKYGKSWAQVMLRWGLQKGFVVLPKSVTPFRITENGNIFDFNLSDEEMNGLDKLSVAESRQCWNPMTEEWDI